MHSHFTSWSSFLAYHFSLTPGPSPAPTSYHIHWLALYISLVQSMSSSVLSVCCSARASRLHQVSGPVYGTPGLLCAPILCGHPLGVHRCVPAASTRVRFNSLLSSRILPSSCAVLDPNRHGCLPPCACHLPLTGRTATLRMLCSVGCGQLPRSLLPSTCHPI